ncbi:MAG: type IV pilus secretin PilQ [Thiomargarita sp.]|nr:type IV pilus secretin PilQ [Thiomargarita sp.]
MSYSLFFSQHVIASDDLNRLQNADFSILTGNRVQIQLSFANNAITHKNFSTDNPARIVLDFPNTKLELKKKSQSIGIGLVENMRMVEASDRIRVVINLVRMTNFDINTVDNKVLISMENSTASTQIEDVELNIEPIISNTPQVQKISVPHIQDIDFHRTKEGAGKITISLSESSIMANMYTEGADIILEFANTVLPEHLDRRLNVVDFGTPITIIDTSSTAHTTRIKITNTGSYAHHAYQTDNSYVIEVKSKQRVDNSTIAIEEREYEGQLVSFNFQKIDVRAVLKLLFELPGVNKNMIVSDDISGTVTLRLNNVPWDHAFDIILEARGLGKQEIGNVVMIDLQKKIDKRKETKLSAQKRIKQLEPLQTEFIHFNYANAADFMANITALANKDGRTFLSDRGVLMADTRTNSLMIKDTAAEISQIRKLIVELDIPVRQVLIEARVVIANSAFTRDLGMKFGYSVNKDLGNDYGAVFGGKLPGDTDFSGATGISGGNQDGFLVSLPGGSPNAAAGLAIGKIGSYLLQLELTAMQSEGKGEVISSPRIITGNQQAATITQGTKIPYAVIGTLSAAPEIKFEEAVLKLAVTPQITPDNRISLDLVITKDAPGVEINGQTSIDNRGIQTNVLVDNGETVVLGGVYERTISQGVDHVPFLSSLPLIGDFFKHKSNKEVKSELLIFVTPRILKDK